MDTYFIINLLVTLLSGLSLVLLADAPARNRFYVSLFVLCCWLIPWPYLQLSHDFQALYLPFNIVFELKNLVPDIAGASQALAQIPQAQVTELAWLNLKTLSLWFWSASILIGLLLFSRDVLSYYRLQRQWHKLSISNNGLWQQAGFQNPYCEIRCLHGCGPGMATGLLKPIIWLNQQQQHSSTLATILLHELTHIRQHDPKWLWVINLIKCLLWWNPLIHWLSRYAIRQIELSCDEQCQQHLPKGHYQAQLIELTLWANKQRQTLSSQAEKSMPMILEMSSTKAFNLQRIQHLNKEAPMKLRYNIVLAALLSTTLGIGLSNAKVNNLTTDEPEYTSQAAQSDSVAQAFQLMAVNDYQGASAILTNMTSHIEQYNPQQQFDIWYFSAVSLSQQKPHDPEILSLFDKAFALANHAEQPQLNRALRTAVALSLSLEQPEKLLNYVKLWKTLGTEIPQETLFYVAAAHYQLQQYDLSSNQLESLITEVENQGQDAQESWLGLLVGSYTELHNYAKAYEVQQKNEALYPNEKNQRLLADLKLAAQSI